MYIQISFPIVDTRPFIESDTYQIRAPNWYKKGKKQQEFVRHFGHIRMANQYIAYLGKTPYSLSKGALKLPHFNDYNFLNDTNVKGPIQAPYPYRRLFVKMRRSNNHPFSCEARFDFGVKIKPNHHKLFDIPDLIAPEESIYKVIKRFVEFPVTVGTLEGKKRIVEQATGQIGPSIANLYLYASSQRGQRHQVKKYWVNALQPTILLHIYNERNIPLTFIDKIDPNKIIQKASNDSFQLIHFEYEAFGDTIPVWLMIRNSSSQLSKTRESLITWNIIRLHSEYQTVMNLSELIFQDRLKFTPRSAASQCFQYFIDEALGEIDPVDDFASHKTIFERLAQKHYELVRAEDCLKLIQNLSHIRKNVLRKLGNFNLSTKPHDNTPIEKLIDEDRLHQLSGINQRYIDKATTFVNSNSIGNFEGYIRNLIGQGDLEKCLETLRAFLILSKIQGNSLNTITLQLMRYNTGKRDSSRGLIPYDQFFATQLQISQAVLDTFEEIKGMV